MKKFWFINIAITLLVLIIVLQINSHFYNTIWDMGAAIASLLLFGVQFVTCGIFLFINRRKYTYPYFFLGICFLGFLILSALFIFNGIIWDTDTGWLRGIN